MACARIRTHSLSLLSIVSLCPEPYNWIDTWGTQILIHQRNTEFYSSYCIYLYRKSNWLILGGNCFYPLKIRTPYFLDIPIHLSLLDIGKIFLHLRKADYINGNLSKHLAFFSFFFALNVRIRSDFSSGMKWNICLLQVEDVNDKSFSFYLLVFVFYFSIMFLSFFIQI